MVYVDFDRLNYKLLQWSADAEMHKIKARRSFANIAILNCVYFFVMSGSILLSKYLKPSKVMWQKFSNNLEDSSSNSANMFIPRWLKTNSSR